MSSPVITWIADATSVNFSGRFETELTSMFISSSKLSFFNLEEDRRLSCVWAKTQFDINTRLIERMTGKNGQ